MSRQLTVSDELYREFQLALTLTGEDAEAVLAMLINQYVCTAYSKAMKKETVLSDKSAEIQKEDGFDQKQLFTNWFRSLTRNGKTYNPTTINGYVGRIEKACHDPAFASVSVRNLFYITDLEEYIRIQKQIMECPGFDEFDAKSHKGFTAALKKYEEFLRFRKYGASEAGQPPESFPVHRWTREEDFICCSRFIERYVIMRSDMDIAQFLGLLAQEVPEVPEVSLRMKIQNIKHLSRQAGLRDTSAFGPLSNCSRQCKEAFHHILRELNIT